MKKLGLTAVVLAALCGSASAADMPLKAMAPVGFNWTGLYVGGHVGYGWNDTDITDSNLISLAIGVPALHSFTTSGFLGGGTAGFNYQIGKLVIGTEYDISWSDVNQTGTANFTAFGVVPATAARTSNLEWFGTATTRIGYAAWDRTMIYSKAGVAYAQFNYTDVVSFGGAPVYTSSASENRIGWTVGTGIEWSLGNRWSAKVEYDYMDFGRNTVALAPIGGFPITLDINNRVSTVKAGLNFAIGGM